CLNTLHGRLDVPELLHLYREFAGIPVVSISDSQRTPLPWINWQATVYHGLPRDLYELREGPREYLAFLGRISPEKGADRAIEIAQRVGMHLKIAAKVDDADQDYYEHQGKPLLRGPHAEFTGEIGGAEKGEVLGNGTGLLFRIDLRV